MLMYSQNCCSFLPTWVVYAWLVVSEQGWRAQVGVAAFDYSLVWRGLALPHPAGQVHVADPRVTLLKPAGTIRANPCFNFTILVKEIYCVLKVRSTNRWFKILTECYLVIIGMTQQITHLRCRCRFSFEFAFILKRRLDNRLNSKL